jgi:predicted amidohydrolase YtcJ
MRILLLLPALTLATISVAREATADSVLLNGRIYTADAKERVVSALAVRGEKFVAAGTDKQIKRLIGPKTRVIDLRGRFVTPGLSDAHFHSEGGGNGVDLSQTRNLASLIDAVQAAVVKARPGELIVSNGDWHEAQLAEQRLPTAGELDVVSPNNPVVLVRGGHSYILNSVALKKWNVTKATPVPPGGAITLDEKGELTGEILDKAREMVPLPPPPPVTEADIIATQQALNRYGITAVRIPGAYKGDLLKAYGLLKQADAKQRLTLRYVVYLPGFAMRSADEAKAMLARWNVQQDEGGDWLRIGGVKLAVDGGFEGGHMLHPYEEPYGKGGLFNGLMTVNPQQFAEVVSTFNQLGWRVATHAVGDAAVAEVLDGYAVANAAQPIGGKRWVIEHAFVTNPSQVQRMKQLGLMLSVQDHLYLAAPVLKRYWGMERAAHVTPLKDYLDAGLIVAGGTDTPVVPFNPFWELYHFATRDTISDGIYGADQAVLSRKQLLNLVTINYARLIGEEARKGSIEAGKLADFAVLSDDFLAVDAKRIPDMRSLATYVGGKEVYRDPSF